MGKAWSGKRGERSDGQGGRKGDETEAERRRDAEDGRARERRGRETGRERERESGRQQVNGTCRHSPVAVAPRAMRSPLSPVLKTVPRIYNHSSDRLPEPDRTLRRPRSQQLDMITGSLWDGLL